MGIKEQRVIPVKNRIHRQEPERISVKQGNLPVRKQTLDIQESGNRETRFRRWIANIQNRNASIVADRKKHCDKQRLSTLPGMSELRAMAEEGITEQMEGGEELREAVHTAETLWEPAGRMAEHGRDLMGQAGSCGKKLVESLSEGAKTVGERNVSEDISGIKRKQYEETVKAKETLEKQAGETIKTKEILEKQAEETIKTKETIRIQTEETGKVKWNIAGKTQAEEAAKLKMKESVKKNVKEAAKKQTRDTAKKKAKDTAKGAAREVTKESLSVAASTSAKITAEVAAEAGTEIAGTVIGSGAGGEGALIGAAVGYLAGKRIGNQMEEFDMKHSIRIRKLRYFHDKMKEQEEQKDSIGSLIRDVAIRRILTTCKVADPIKKYILVSSVIVYFLVTIPILMCASAFYHLGTGIPAGQGSMTEEQVEGILEAIEDGTERQVCRYALSKVGYPYDQSRRDSGEAYDCSSLAHWAWDSAGVDITYQGMSTAAMEAKGLHEAGREVDFAELQPGDLIFWAWEGSPGGGYLSIDHVAVYIGDGYIVEAANEDVGVVYHPVYSIDRIVMSGRPEAIQEAE